MRAKVEMLRGMNITKSDVLLAPGVKWVERRAAAGGDEQITAKSDKSLTEFVLK
jgi:hypothetical protein